MMRSYYWPATILFGGLLIISTQVAHLSLPPFLLLAYLLICPGMAYIRLIGLQDQVAEWVLAIALSITMMTLFSEIMALTAHWSPWLAVLVLIGLSWLGALWQIFHIRRLNHSRASNPIAQGTTSQPMENRTKPI